MEIAGLIVGSICFVAGLVFIFVGFQFRNPSSSKTRGWLSTKGQIVDIKRHSNWGGKRIFTPIVLYHTLSGQQGVFEGFGSQLPIYDVSQVVEVIYNPNNLREAHIKGDKGKRLVSFIFFGIGVVALLKSFLWFAIGLISLVSRFM